MSIDLSPLAKAPRLLFEIPLKPLQGHRFQPTGFPNLGAATFQTKGGLCLLVESAQSMANRLELTIWDGAQQDLKADFTGLSHVRVLRKKAFLTDSILEPHRLNSAYIEKSAPMRDGDSQIHAVIENAIFPPEIPLLNRQLLARTLFRYDIGSLIHGAFLESIDGRIRVARALSAFIEADLVQIAASGGVKNDHVNPSGVTKEGFGNVPFARDEFTAERITLYVNVDLAQIRGYGLDVEEADEVEEDGKKSFRVPADIDKRPFERLLVLLALYKLRALLDDNLRLRTACELCVVSNSFCAITPAGFALPDQEQLLAALKPAIKPCANDMSVSEVSYDAPLTKGKEEPPAEPEPGEENVDQI